MKEKNSGIPINQEEIQQYLKDIRKKKVMTPQREKELAVLMKSGTLSNFQDIIVSIDSQSYERNRQFEIYRCKVTLTDGSNLRILEKYEQENLAYYSYYWLTFFNELIIGWDCAPHHPDLESYPHHKHINSQKNLTSSDERNLREVLAFIKSNLS